MYLLHIKHNTPARLIKADFLLIKPVQCVYVIKYHTLSKGGSSPIMFT